MIKILGYNEIIESRGGGEHGYNDMTQYDIYYKNLEDNKIYKCHLDNNYGDCPSGRTSASWGNKEITCVDNVGTLHFMSNEDLLLETIEEMIVVEYDGGCGRYPSGYANIKDEYVNKFTKTPRYKDKRQVYIFTGESRKGKSYIAHATEFDIYETDSSNKLKEEINKATIIVLGNKFPFTIEDVKEKVGENVDYINVTFN